MRICELDRQRDANEPALAVRERVFPLEPDAEDILFSLKRRRNSVFLSDWTTAYDLRCALRNKKRRPRMMVFPLKYDEALPVGYCIPKGDIAARYHIARALHEAFLGPNQSWKVDFASAVEATGVHLDESPEDILSAVSGDIQVGQNRMSV